MVGVHVANPPMQRLDLHACKGGKKEFLLAHRRRAGLCRRGVQLQAVRLGVARSRCVRRAAHPTAGDTSRQRGLVQRVRMSPTQLVHKQAH